MLAAVARAERTAYRQIVKYGAAATLTRPVTSSVSAAGQPTMGTSLTTTTVGTFLPLSAYTDNRDEQRALAQKGVRFLALAARGMTLEPRPHDVIAIGGVNWRVESSTPINPAGDAIAHRALVVKL